MRERERQTDRERQRQWERRWTSQKVQLRKFSVPTKFINSPFLFKYLDKTQLVIKTYHI